MDKEKKRDLAGNKGSHSKMPETVECSGLPDEAYNGQVPLFVPNGSMLDFRYLEAYVACVNVMSANAQERQKLQVLVSPG